MVDTKPRSVNVQVCRSIDGVPAVEWNRLAGNNPFVQHEFFAALEHSGCACAGAGWTPLHLMCTDVDGHLTGALPLYLKTHSYGEYVFDWAWADAWQRAGVAYYPKLVSAVPFSPVSGPRLLLEQSPAGHEVAGLLINKAHEILREHTASSIHCLFPDNDELQHWDSRHYLLRKDCQFHWHNRGYKEFGDFLGALSAEPRKKIKRERRRVDDVCISHKMLHASELDARLLDVLYRFYQATYTKRARTPYLNREFFQELASTLPDSLLVNFAFHTGKPVACAIFFRNADTLYGRHWGCELEYHSLHFETCYYQGIEYCIREGLQHFNPGTQGEHKLARGFQPTATRSLHWIAEPEFRGPIADFLRQEASMIDAYMLEAQRHSPFRAQSRQ